MHNPSPAVWVAFIAFIVALLLIDVLVVHRNPTQHSTRRALIESGVWIAIGLSFSLVMLAWQGGQAAGEYLSGYLIEKSLSVDNIFVWAVILDHFAVDHRHRHRVLFWGVFGALAMRAVFIVVGVSVIHRFEWVTVVFGAILLWSALKILRSGDDDAIDPANSKTLKLVRRLVPSTDEYRGQKFFVRENGRRLATPLFAVLVLVEVSDLLFAVDSIPAVLSVSREQFIVYSSNAFAILGLRSLFFVLDDLEERFAYLRHGVAIILLFVGVKMLTHHWWEMPTAISLTVIAGVLLGAILLSPKAGRREEPAH